MKTISTTSAPAAIGPYAQGNIAGGLLFASGQIPLDPETGEIVGSTIEEQTAQVMKNVAAILEAAGTDFDHVVKTTTLPPSTPSTRSPSARCALRARPWRSRSFPRVRLWKSK